MMNCLPAGKSIGSGLVRLVTRLVREAARRLGKHAEPTTKDIHEARVALKRARSTLRLMEKAGAEWAWMPRMRLAAQARKLSAARESAVATKLVRRLRRQWQGSRRELAGLLLKSQPAIAGEDCDGIKAALRWEAAMLTSAPPPRITRQTLRNLLRQSLERVADCHRLAALWPSDENVHEWRKSVIVLRDQTGLAAAIWPDGAGVAQQRLIRLARALGANGDTLLLVDRFRRLTVPPRLMAAQKQLVARLRSERKRKTAKLVRAWPALARELQRLLTG